MPTRARRRCTRCGNPHPTSPCPGCTTRLTRRSERRRPTATARGYTSTGHDAFRQAVLARDSHCVCPGCPSCTIPRTLCARTSTDADHHPRTRRQLLADGENPNDPRHGRGLCHRCHSHATVAHDGGFGRKPRGKGGSDLGGGPPQTAG